VILSFPNIATGIQTDVDPNELPATPQAFVWSNGSNVRFLDGYAQKIEGHSSVGTATVAPYWLQPVATATDYFWLCAGLAKVYVTTDFTTFNNITRQTAAVDVDYTGTASNLWNGGVISTIPVINNGVDDPQMWTPTTSGTRLQSLTWDATHTWSSKTWSAKVFRPYKEFLLALDTIEAGTRYPQRLRWSTSTLSGVPSTWDDTDATEDAGYTEINESQGYIIDCLPLRGSNIVYKEDQTWIQQYIGGNDIFRFESLFTESGIMSQKCAKPFFGKHLVLTQGDLILHDGQSIESVIEKRMKKYLFNNIDSSYYQRSFIVPNYRKKEMWICFPSTGSTEPDTALIWNYNDNTYAVRTLPNTPHIGYGVIDPTASTIWDTDTQVWDLDTTTWDERAYNPTVKKLLMASGTSLFQADDTEQFNGTNYTSYIERTGIDLGAPDRFKFIKRVYVKASSDSGSFTVKVGSQKTKNDSVTWTTHTFDPSTTDYIDCLVNGRYIAIRFESTSAYSWSVKSFDIEYDLGSRF